MAEYPSRDSHFAHRHFRLMTKVCAAQDMGCDAMLLVAVILHQEDAKRYRSPVTFYNDQLMPILGFGKWDRLDRARRAAMNAGWLHYEAAKNRKAGVYWATIPKGLDDVDDSPIDEGIIPSTGDENLMTIPSTGDENLMTIPSTGDENLMTIPSTGDENLMTIPSTGDENLMRTGQAGYEQGEPPILSPKPKPTKKTGTGTGAGFLNLLSAGMMGSIPKLLKWFDRASAGEQAVIPPGRPNEINLVGTARRILDDRRVTNKAACLVRCIQNRQFRFSEAIDAWADVEVKKVRSRSAGRRSPPEFPLPAIKGID